MRNKIEMLCIVLCDCVWRLPDKIHVASSSPGSMLGPCVTVKHFNLLHENVCVNLLTRAVVVPTVASCWLSLCHHAVTGRLESSSLVPQIDPSVAQPVVQSRRRPLLGPSPGWKRLLALSHLRHYAKQALTPRSLNVKLGPRRNYHKGRAALC